jgi:hypothetical protein
MQPHEGTAGCPAKSGSMMDPRPHANAAETSEWLAPSDVLPLARQVFCGRVLWESCATACRFAEVGDSLALMAALRRAWREPGEVMKSCGATRLSEACAIKLASAALVLMLAAAAPGTSLAQDASKGDTSKADSSWERLDSVLVVPPVYRLGSAAPVDACAEDCPDSYVPTRGGAPIVVIGSADDPTNASAGTADNPTNESVAVSGSALDGRGSQERHDDAVGSQQHVDGVDGLLATAGGYPQQQATAQSPGNYGIGPVPYVIIGVPVGSHAPAAAASNSQAGVPARSFPTSPVTSPAWMPQPMARAAPLPPMVSKGFQPAGGDSPAGFPPMSGFSAGPGHR